MKNVGIIGTGIMGKHVAMNLLKGDFELSVFDSNPAATAPLQAAGAVYRSLQDLASQCSIIFTMLPDGEIVKEVLLGENGVATYAQKGTIISDLSSIQPEEAKFLGEALALQGIHYLDSPVSGGELRAENGTLALMIGGNIVPYETMLPYYSLIGDSMTLVGDIGCGSITKLVNQVIVNMNLVAISEGFVLAAKAGADPQRVYEAIRNGAAGSTIMDMKFPIMMDRSFGPSAKISINYKDIKNVLLTSHHLSVPLPFTAMMFEALQAMINAGQADEDHAAIVKYFERLANIEISE